MPVCESTGTRRVFTRSPTRFRFGQCRFDSNSRGVKDDFSVCSVNKNNIAVNEDLGGLGADNRGQSLLARKDRGVRGGPAVSGDESSHDVEVEQRRVRRCQVASDENKRSVRLRDTGSRNAQNPRDNTVGDIAEVTGTFGHVAAGHFENLRESGKRLENRTLSGRAAVDSIFDVGEKHLVIRHQCEVVENFLGQSPGTSTAVAEVLRGRLKGSVRTRKLGVGSDSAVRLGGFGKRVGHSSDITDDDAATDTYSCERTFRCRHSASWSVSRKVTSWSRTASASSPSALMVTVSP